MMRWEEDEKRVRRDEVRRGREEKGRGRHMSEGMMEERIGGKGGVC